MSASTCVKNSLSCVDMYYCMNISVGAGAAAEVDGPGTGDREPDEASGC